MTIDKITEQAGGRPRRKRRGRGEGSGLGKSSGRGTKGMGARAGSGPYPLHEGGAAPLFRRLPKRGFSNVNFRTEYSVVNLADLEASFENGGRVDLDSLRKLRLVRGADALVKVLGQGELHKKLSVEVHAVSASARAAIEKAGGSIRLLERRNPAALAKAKRNSAKKARQAKAATGGKS